MKKIQQGFTLIELMIVVAIVGILAAVALPAYQDYTARAQMAEAMSLISAPRGAVSEYYANYGDWPASNEEAGLAAATDITGNYVYSVSIVTDGDGLIRATMKSSGIAEGIRDATLDLSPVTTAGSITWTCKRGTGPNAVLAKYVPAACRGQ